MPHSFAGCAAAAGRLPPPCVMLAAPDPMVGILKCPSSPSSPPSACPQRWAWEQHAAGQLMPLARAQLAALQQPVALPAEHLAAGVALVLATLCALWLLRREHPIYLLDFECYRPGALGCSQARCRGSGATAAGAARATPEGRSAPAPPLAQRSITW